MNNEVKHYWPEEIVGTGELVVYLQDYAALEAECEKLADELDRKSVITGDYIARCQRLAAKRDDLHAELVEARANDRCAMFYLSEVRGVVGGDDFPMMVLRVNAMAAERDQLRAELERVTGELSNLQSALAEPNELTAEPASDYENLRQQYLSLRMLTNSALARNRYLCRRDTRDMRAALSVNAANVSAERDTNAMLTELLEKAESERDAALAELAEVKESGWRNYSVNFARGEKCPPTLEAAQAAWDRDQELIEEQRAEIAKLKQTINQLRQKQ